jgi:hypothetical protein
MNFVEKGHHLTIVAAVSIVALFACSFAGSGSLAKSPSLQHQPVMQAAGFDGLVPPPPPPPRT